MFIIATENTLCQLVLHKVIYIINETIRVIKETV